MLPAKFGSSSETAWQNGAKLGKKHLCKVLYKVSSFRSAWPTNMAAKSNSCFKWNHMKKLYRVSYIDASCQVWFHLAQLFQRRLKCEKVNGQTSSGGNTSHA
jgi:hypothetical protein